MSKFGNVRYVIITKTKDTHAAGIVSALFMKIHGSFGSTKPIELGGDTIKKTGARTNRSPFSQNSTSKFTVGREDIGDVLSIEVWHDSDRSWGCETIEIQKGNTAYMFRPLSPIASQTELEKQGKKGERIRLKGEKSAISSGATRFHEAARTGDIDGLEKMINDGEYGIDSQDKLGRTAVHYAVLYGQFDALELLVEFQASITIRDNEGKHCLHHAAVNHVNNIAVVNLLLEEVSHANLDPTEFAGNSGDSEVERYIKSKDGYGKNAIHYAATHGFVETLQLLESKCSVAMRDKDNTGQTPLHCAGIQGEIQTCLILIDLGALVDSPDREGKTFLHHAASNGHAELIRTVLSYSFPHNIKKHVMGLLNAEDSYGRSPLLCAAAAAELATVKVLYEFDTQIYRKDNDQNSALHLAARLGDDPILSFLSLKHDINSSNDFEYTPLHVAVDSNNLRAARWFIKHKADLYATVFSGETAVDIAKKNGNSTMARAIENALALTAHLQLADGQSSRRDEDSNLRGGVPLSAPTDKVAETALIPEPVAFADAEPSFEDTELIAENQDLQHKVGHLQQALLEKNRIIQQYRNKHGMIDGDNVNTEEKESDCSIM